MPGGRGLLHLPRLSRTAGRARCPQAGAPCIGCYGAAPEALDQGARMMTAIASVIEGKDAAAIDAVLDGIPDPAGMFYRFSLAHSLLRGSRAAHQETEQA